MESLEGRLLPEPTPEIESNFANDTAQIQAAPVAASQLPTKPVLTPNPTIAAPPTKPREIDPAIVARLEQIYEMGVIERNSMETYCLDSQGRKHKKYRGEKFSTWSF